MVIEIDENDAHFLIGFLIFLIDEGIAKDMKVSECKKKIKKFLIKVEKEERS